MFKTIMATVSDHKMLDKDDLILVALSGGVDSVCLLRFLHKMRNHYKIKLAAAHVNHGLRGSYADGDEKFCVDLCGGLGIDISVMKADVPAYAESRRLSTEEAARDLRYEALRAAAHKIGATKTAVAHNRDDQAETVLMRLMRGTGLRGLCGIPAVNGRIIRPLLDTPRAEIEKYLHDNGHRYVTDETNHDTYYIRNKIRNHLIPLIKTEYNPSITDTLNSAAKVWRDEDDYMEEAAAAALGSCRTENRLAVKPLAAHHPAIRRRVIRAFIAAETGQSKDITAKHIERVLSLTTAETGKRVPIIKTFTAERKKEFIVVFDKTDEV